MAEGIRDKVAIVGMGCTRFGERWDCSAEDLMVEAFEEALADANIERDRIEAAWFGLSSDDQGPGKSALSLSTALRLPNIAATRVENMCATGTEALRGAVYGVASGAYDVALALGVEKLKDTGYGGLPERTKGTHSCTTYAPTNGALTCASRSGPHLEPRIHTPSSDAPKAVELPRTKPIAPPRATVLSWPSMMAKSKVPEMTAA